jgi:hypothetical protein
VVPLTAKRIEDPLSLIPGENAGERRILTQVASVWSVRGEDLHYGLGARVDQAAPLLDPLQRRAAGMDVLESLQIASGDRHHTTGILDKLSYDRPAEPQRPEILAARRRALTVAVNGVARNASVYASGLVLKLALIAEVHDMLTRAAEQVGHLARPEQVTSIHWTYPTIKHQKHNNQ